MTAAEVLRVMADKYRELKTYEDRGSVITRYPDSVTPNEVKFATYFRRPDRFRFDWTTHHPYEPLRHIETHRKIWSDGTPAFLFNSRNGVVEKQDNLVMAIAGATGVSKGAAHTIPVLLMPELGGFVLTQLECLSLSSDQLGDADCYKIEGKHPLGGERHELWIGRHDLFLRKLRYPDTAGVDSFELRTDIQANHMIADAVFTGS